MYLPVVLKHPFRAARLGDVTVRVKARVPAFLDQRLRNRAYPSRIDALDGADAEWQADREALPGVEFNIDGLVAVRRPRNGPPELPDMQPFAVPAKIPDEDDACRRCVVPTSPIGFVKGVDVPLIGRRFGDDLPAGRLSFRHLASPP